MSKGNNRTVGEMRDLFWSLVVGDRPKGISCDVYDYKVRDKLVNSLAKQSDLEAKNKRLETELRQYEEDSAELLEKHGIDPNDKVDREDLKRMLNYLIGKNKWQKEALENISNMSRFSLIVTNLPIEKII